MKRYCNECRVQLGYFQNIPADFNFTGSEYLLDKFLKHILPVECNDKISIFNDKNYKQYKEYIVNANLSGSIEVLDNNNVNILLIVENEIGQLYLDGTKAPIIQDTIKVVLSNNLLRIHAFPTSSNELKNYSCENCQKNIF